MGEEKAAEVLLPLLLLLRAALATLLSDSAVGIRTNIEPAYPTLASGLGIFSSNLSFDAISTIIHVPLGKKCNLNFLLQVEPAVLAQKNLGLMKMFLS